MFYISAAFAINYVFRLFMTFCFDLYALVQETKTILDSFLRPRKQLDFMYAHIKIGSGQAISL